MLGPSERASAVNHDGFLGDEQSDDAMIKKSKMRAPSLVLMTYRHP